MSGTNVACAVEREGRRGVRTAGAICRGSIPRLRCAMSGTETDNPCSRQKLSLVLRLRRCGQRWVASPNRPTHLPCDPQN
eukprot:3486925-Rhodomonas_salina.2